MAKVGLGERQTREACETHKTGQADLHDNQRSPSGLEYVRALYLGTTLRCEARVDHGVAQPSP